MEIFLSCVFCFVYLQFLCESLPCRLIGMNADLMSEYIQFVADRLLVALMQPKVSTCFSIVGEPVVDSFAVVFFSVYSSCVQTRILLD